MRNLPEGLRDDIRIPYHLNSYLSANTSYKNIDQDQGLRYTSSIYRGEREELKGHGNAFKYYFPLFLIFRTYFGQNGNGVNSEIGRNREFGSSARFGGETINVDHRCSKHVSTRVDPHYV